MKLLGKSIVWPVAGLVLGLSLLSPPTRWELDWGLLGTEPWRLLTGHLVHWSTEHLVWDLAVFLGLGMACELTSRRRTALALALAVVGIGCGARLWTPGLAVYRGLSGLDAALFTQLAARCLRGPSRTARLAGALALAGLLGKVGWEMAMGGSLFLPELSSSEGVIVVPSAHLLGGLAGLVAGWPRRLAKKSLVAFSPDSAYYYLKAGSDTLPSNATRRLHHDPRQPEPETRARERPSPLPCERARPAER